MLGFILVRIEPDVHWGYDSGFDPWPMVQLLEIGVGLAVSIEPKLRTF